MTDLKKTDITPDYLFETSWEVCNKVGGIYTVISTKALTLVTELKDNYICIGPDVFKEDQPNPDFTEDRFLFRSWREKAESEGLNIRIGRWNINGNPVVILVDFTPFFSQKDKIFAKFWETYKLDSISGDWDYIEPALFGYAAGKTIESFYRYNLSSQDKLVAHFHEWMTGAGILHLKEFVPQAGTVFTTHATVLGRSIAGNGMPLYRDLFMYQGESIARQFGLVSKHSLEYLSANVADCLTTVSDITNEECRQFFGKEADIVTPNGFEDTFLPPKEHHEEYRNKARKKLLEVARGLLNQNLSDESVLLINSGRYEFRNKGIDLFIDTLGKLNQQTSLTRDILAFIMVPAYQSGARREVFDRIAHPDFNNPISDEYLTHGLHEPENDSILRRIRERGLRNRTSDRVKILFVPAYLTGNDGIFDMEYYDLLVGFDGSVFPSYYEPWGYTPLESLAFHIPTITTSLAGFGQWIRDLYPGLKDCTRVVERTDDNDEEVVNAMTEAILSCASKNDKAILRARIQAFEISRSALWKNLISHYYHTFTLALDQAASRSEQYYGKQPVGPASTYVSTFDLKPEWKKILVQQRIPENLEGLERLTKNLWWSWNHEGTDLFEMINRERWYELKFNPIALLESLTLAELRELSSNKEFVAKLRAVVARFDAYMAEAANRSEKMVAYFSMEFGLHDTLKIYSGGLGLLAGDYLKEASDSNYNMIGIGLLYRYGYFQQTLSVYGEQVAHYTPQKFTHLPLIPVRDADGNWQKITFVLPGRTLYAKVWRVDVGRIPLYLLDTDFEENQESDRSITHQLYGGDWENRLKQELLLGVGGIRMLDVLGIKPQIYHINEGHSAFIGVERLRRLIQNEHMSFNQALEVVRGSTLFTTHTPVPAGHDTFSEDLLRKYISHVPDHLEIRWEQFMNLGRMTEDDPNEKFSMSILAAKLSQEINGVSRIHGRVTREMFNKLYPGYYPGELHIGYVTNGVHYPTWAAKSWKVIYEKEFGSDFLKDESNPQFWEKIHNVDDSLIWQVRQKQKKQLWDFILDRVYKDMTHRRENPQNMFKIREVVNPNALTIGFARRFATYKRGHLLFTNLERLASIVNNKKRPVQFIFAGKAHPNDKAGQDLIKRIIEVSRMPQFLGKILFVENYDIELAKYLVRGVDIWLNTPTRPMEASGTSGEKAVMNGVLNFSVLDGWWAEGYKPDAGWALSEEITYDNPQFQDELDAETIYNILEDEIAPVFYDVDQRKLPARWIGYIKNTIAGIAPHFTMKRQLDDYIRLYYTKLIRRSELLNSEDFRVAKEIAAWKKKVLKGWNSIEVISVTVPDSSQKPLDLGETFKADIRLSLNELNVDDIGIEVLFGNKVNDVVLEPTLIQEMEVCKNGKNTAVYCCNVPIEKAGVYDYVFRLFPKHPLLPHRQDFPLVKWI